MAQAGDPEGSPVLGHSDGLWQHLPGIRKHEICYFIDRAASHSVFWKRREVDSNMTGKEWGSCSGQGRAESWWSQKNRENDNMRTNRTFSFMEVIAVSLLQSLISWEITLNQPISLQFPYPHVIFTRGKFSKCSEELSFENSGLPDNYKTALSPLHPRNSVFLFCFDGFFWCVCGVFFFFPK